MNKQLEIVLVFAVIALVLGGLAFWFVISPKRKSERDRYHSLGNDGILQDQGDWPYCASCEEAPLSKDYIHNDINYEASDSVMPPNWVARRRMEVSDLQRL